MLALVKAGHIEQAREICAALGGPLDLSGADLRGINLSRGVGPDRKPRANLRGADLRGADLRGADLRGADLRGADLRGALLWWADLRGADFTGAALGYNNFLGADLRDAIGVDP